MKVERIDLDSEVLGKAVLAILDLDLSVDFKAFESGYLASFEPGYVYCKVPLDQIQLIHLLERNGFSLIECQIRSTIKLQKPYDLSAHNQFIYEPVLREEDLKGVLEIAASTFVHDRWTVDPELPSRLAGERYRKYVLHSFQDPAERVFRLREKESGRILAFKTHRLVGSNEVLFLLGGVHPEFKNLGLGLLNEFFEFNELISRGVRKGTTHISAANHPVFNLEIGSLGFRVQATYAVLRKLYT